MLAGASSEGGSGGLTPDAIRARHERLLQRLRGVAETNGHDSGALRIVGVTKGQSIDVARRAVAAGMRLLGESRVQEAEPKIAELPDAEWHFIGRLQSNKVRRAVRAFAAIHSVASLDQLRRVGEIATEEGVRPRLLIEVNVTGEASKTGLEPAALAATDAMRAIRDAGVEGLMTIAPLGATDDEARAAFHRLRELRDDLEQRAGIGLPELSMGMSADAEAAAAEGATLVRIGTALFGPRP